MPAREFQPARTRADWTTGLLILVFTLASAFAVNRYYFGLDDNSITIPFLKASAHPDLYPGDYLIAQRPFYLTILWDVLAFVHARLGIGIPALFFAVYLVALYLTFLGMYRVAFSLFRSREVAFLSLLFLLFVKESLASVYTIETLLSTRMVAAPILLLALHEFLERRIVRCFALMGLAYLAHPLTTHYVLAMIVAASIVLPERRQFRSLGAGVAVFLVLASPILIQRLQHPTPSFHLFSADPQWLLALHARSAHHMFPFSWGPWLWAHALVTLALFGIAWRSRGAESEERHRVIGIAVCVILAMVAVGIVGSEWRPMGVVFLTQPPRAFQFMEYFAMIYVAHFLYRYASAPGPLGRALGAALVSAAIMFGTFRHPWPWLFFAAIAAWLIARGRIRARWLARPSPAAITTSLAVAAAIVWYVGDLRRGEGFSIHAIETSPFVQVQHWAKTNTDVRDGFIVPPYVDEEFRIFAERTHYGDIEDGGLANGNPEFGKEWVRRMKMLGLKFTGFRRLRSGRPRDDFLALDSESVLRIAGEMKPASRRVFLVWPTDGHAMPFRTMYRNPFYIVYAVN